PAKVEVTVKGSEKSETCVWLRGYASDSDVPSPTAGESPIKLKVTAEGAGVGPDDCVKVPKGEQTTLAMRFESEQSVRGFASGALTFATKSSNSDVERDVVIDVTTEFVKPVSAGMAWAIFVALLLLGVALPLLAFYVSNWWVAKFAPLRLLQACAVRVRVRPNGVDRLEPVPSGRLLEPDDFSNHRLGTDANRGARPRSFICSIGPELTGRVQNVPFRTKVSSNPLSPPSGLAGDRRHPVIGSARGNVKGLRGRVNLWVAREWVFIPDPVDDDDAPVTGTVVAFTLATDRAVAVPMLEEQLIERLPALEELARRIMAMQDAPSKRRDSPPDDERDPFDDPILADDSP
ncbi:MAG: hypothetical protein ACOYOQ_16680, partial [Microthrixaceae bacterium]